MPGIILNAVSAVSLGLFSAAAFGAGAPAASSRPNILLVVADQMRGSAMGIAGNHDVQTPHLDALGREGMMFRRAYANVPVCWPARVPKGREVDTLFSHVDMPPTLLALAGLEVPKWMQGTDLSRVVLGQTTEGPDAVLLQIFVPFAGDKIERGWRGIITDQYTYARFESEPWVLFDNARDPSQLKNLAADPRHAALAQRLDARLAQLMREKNDAWSYNRRERVEEGGRLYRHGTFYTVDEYLTWAAANPEKSK